jgi:hypothetical protein
MLAAMGEHDPREHQPQTCQQEHEDCYDDHHQGRSREHRYSRDRVRDEQLP